MHKIKAFKEIVSGNSFLTIVDDFKISFANQKYLSAETIDHYCSANRVNAYRLIDEITDDQQTKLTNCLNFLLHQFVKFCGNNSKFVTNNKWQSTNSLLKNLYVKKYGRNFTVENFINFSEECLTAFSPLFQKLINISTGKSITSSAIFCSKTIANRYSLQNNFFKTQILPNLLKNKKDKELKFIWLGSSRGDTLYDIYKILDQFSLHDWQITLSACDISIASLQFLQKNVWRPLQTKVNLLTIPIILGRKEDMEQIFSQHYDIIFMQNTARYLREDIVWQYSRKLNANYIFTTFDFRPVNYRLLSADIYQKIAQ